MQNDKKMPMKRIAERAPEEKWMRNTHAQPGPVGQHLGSQPAERAGEPVRSPLPRLGDTPESLGPREDDGPAGAPMGVVGRNGVHLQDGQRAAAAEGHLQQSLSVALAEDQPLPVGRKVHPLGVRCAGDGAKVRLVDAPDPEAPILLIRPLGHHCEGVALLGDRQVATQL